MAWRGPGRRFRDATEPVRPAANRPTALPSDSAVGGTTAAGSLCRVDEAVLRDVSMLRLLTSAGSGGTRSLEVVVVHHTDCGTARLADPGLAAAVGEPLAIDPAAVSALAVTDPTTTVLEDVELLRRTFDGLSVDGLVYDVASRELRALTTGDVAA